MGISGCEGFARRRRPVRCPYNSSPYRAPVRGAHGTELHMSVLDRIKAEVEGHPIVLFMKGTPQFPMCGFSSRAVQALKSAGANSLHTVNVLEEPEIRASLP